MAGSIETKAISASNLKLKLTLTLTEAELGKNNDGNCYHNIVAATNCDLSYQ